MPPVDGSEGDGLEVTARRSLTVDSERPDSARSSESEWSVCFAPHSSMYFDQFGNVRPCCQNTGTRLGNVRGQSLREIWESRDTEDVRNRLEHGDYSAGCEFCGWQVDEGNDTFVFARKFDSLRPATSRPRWPRQMEFSLTNTCNLACVMCNGDWSSTIRSKREGKAPIPRVYGDRFFEELAEFIPHLESAEFLGGEPFLGAEPLRVMEMLAELENPPRVTVTTNGTIRTDRVARILALLDPDVVVSLDGATGLTYESIRVGASFDEVLSNVAWFIDRLGPGRVSITHCLMTTNVAEFGQLLRLAEDWDVHVGVNVVRFPAEFSLYQLGEDELRQTVQMLERTDIDGITGQRLVVWNEQLNSLRLRLGVVGRGDSALDPGHGLPGVGGETPWLPFPRVGEPASEGEIAPPGGDIDFAIDEVGNLSIIEWNAASSVPFTRGEAEQSGFDLLKGFLESTFGYTLQVTRPDTGNPDRVLIKGSAIRERGSPTMILRMEGVARRDRSGYLTGGRYRLRLDFDESWS